MILQYRYSLPWRIQCLSQRHHPPRSSSIPSWLELPSKGGGSGVPHLVHKTPTPNIINLCCFQKMGNHSRSSHKLGLRSSGLWRMRKWNCLHFPPNTTSWKMLGRQEEINVSILTGSALFWSPSSERDCKKGTCNSGYQIGYDLGSGPSVPWNSFFNWMPNFSASSGGGGTNPSVFWVLISSTMQGMILKSPFESIWETPASSSLHFQGLQSLIWKGQNYVLNASTYIEHTVIFIDCGPLKCNIR